MNHFYLPKVVIGCLMSKKFKNELKMAGLFLAKVVLLDQYKKFLLQIENLKKFVPNLGGIKME